MAPIRLLDISGSPYDMGYQHGKTYARDILDLTEERVHLSSDPNWTGRTLSREEVLALGEACLAEHRAYAPALMEELRGVADAVAEQTGTRPTLGELIIMNGFTDFIDTLANAGAPEPVRPANPAADNCTAFIVPPDSSADGRGFIGQTWDMHKTATPYVIMLRGKPDDGPAFLTFTITGCVGMIGMNDAGIAVGINNLMAADGQPGVTWPFVIRKALMQTDLDAALACITDAKLAGGHNYILADSTGRGYNVEATATHYEIEATDGHSITHTNHCLTPRNVDLSRPRSPDSQASSEERLQRARELLNENRRITVDDLIALTRDQTYAHGICAVGTAPVWVETCGAAIMRPASREMWAVWGLPVDNDYERFTL